MVSGVMSSGGEKETGSARKAKVTRVSGSPPPPTGAPNNTEPLAPRGVISLDWEILG